MIEPTHFAELPGPRSNRPRGVTRKLEKQLLARWPALEDFLAGVKLRAKTLVHLHLRRLVALAEQYGDAALLAAALRAHEAGLHTAQSVARILERDFPEVDGHIPAYGADGPEGRLAVWARWFLFSFERSEVGSRSCACRRLQTSSPRQSPERGG